MKYLLFITTAILLSSYTSAQLKMKEPYNQEWKKADSLLQKGFPESAANIVNNIHAKAAAKGEEVQVLKAELFLLQTDFQTQEEAFNATIQQAEKKAAQAVFPHNAIWQSITAQLYWSYYERNRWKIMNRTRVGDDVTIRDFEQWDAARFFQK